MFKNRILHSFHLPGFKKYIDKNLKEQLIYPLNLEVIHKQLNNKRADTKWLVFSGDGDGFSYFGSSN